MVSERRPAEGQGSGHCRKVAAPRGARTGQPQRVRPPKPGKQREPARSGTAGERLPV